MSEFNPNAKPEQTAEKKKLFGWFSKKKQRDNSDNEIPYDELEDKEVTLIEQASDSRDTPEQPAEANESTQEQSKLSFYKKLKQGLSKTRGQFSSGLANLVLGQKEIDEDSLEEIETLLLMADVGVETTSRIIDDLTERSNRKELKSTAALIAHLRGQLLETLTPVQQPLIIQGHQPFVILLVGINGVGKTTTIGKMAHKFIAEGKSVMLAAGDTFRAAAVEQLKAWGDRNNVAVVAQHTGADSASVIY
ncbi:MAG: signal recognition particle receptor subunit alpha, partial [Kangiellaceae bacterium]|nr:signal recognition particle receptor subunit alpha [Kangiellaceae bacterium]